MTKLRHWLGTSDLAGILILGLVILVVMPLTADTFRLNLIGKYLTYAFVAVGLVMLWGTAAS